MRLSPVPGLAASLFSAASGCTPFCFYTVRAFLGGRTLSIRSFRACRRWFLGSPKEEKDVRFGMSAWGFVIPRVSRWAVPFLFRSPTTAMLFRYHGEYPFFFFFWVLTFRLCWGSLFLFFPVMTPVPRICWTCWCWLRAGWNTALFRITVSFRWSVVSVSVARWFPNIRKRSNVIDAVVTLFSSIKRLCVRRRVMLRAVSVSTVFPFPGVRISFFRRVRKREVQMWRCWSIGIWFLLYILLFPFMRIIVQRWMNRLFPNNPVMILSPTSANVFQRSSPPLFPWSNI